MLMKPIAHTLLFLLFGGVFSFAQTAQTAEIPQPQVAFPFDVKLAKPDSSAEKHSKKIFPAGKPVVIAFWLTTCPPCREELAAYTREYPGWKKEVDFELFAISMDFANRFRQIATLMNDGGWPFPVYWDRTRYFRAIMPGELNGLPQVFLFDKNGKLVRHHKGYKPGDEHALFEAVKKAANTP